MKILAISVSYKNCGPYKMSIGLPLIEIKRNTRRYIYNACILEKEGIAEKKKPQADPKPRI
jgi:hypothetical protein